VTHPIHLHQAVSHPDDFAAIESALRGAPDDAAWVARFERRFADFVPRPYAVAAGSPGGGYETALRGLGIGVGDEVLLPAIGPAAAVDAVVRCGATPVFADVDPSTLVLTAQRAEPRIGERTRAIMAFALLGDASGFAELARLCTKHEIVLIEDASDAIGARTAGEPTGRFGRVAIFALTDDRPLPVAGATLLLTHDDRLAANLQSIRGDAAPFAPRSIEALGTPDLAATPMVDCPLDAFRAALGVQRLDRLDAALEHRRQLADAYLRRLAGHPELILPAACDEGTVWPRFCLRLSDRFSHFDRDEIIAGMRRHEIEAARGSPALSQRFAAPEGGATCPIAERAAGRSILLPFHERLVEREIDLVCQTLALMISRLEFRRE